MKKAILSVIVLSIGLVFVACSGEGDRQPAGPGEPTSAASVVALYSAAINSRSFDDYLALHADGFAIERPDDGRDCHPWLDEGWWIDGSLPPECSLEPSEVTFRIVNQRSDVDREDVFLDVDTVFLVNQDTGWFSESQLVLELAWLDDALLITRVVEPPF
jgi:hypothetical protein